MNKHTSHPHFGCPVAIMGGRGYLGRHVSLFLDQSGCKFWVVGRQPSENATDCSYQYRSSVPILADSISGASTVLHLATLTTPSLSNENNYLDIENIRFTLNLIKACEQEKVKHLIFASSGGTVYGDTEGKPATELTPPNPLSSYSIAKIACERYLNIAARNTLIKVTVLRISNIYGGTQAVRGQQGVVPYIVKRCLENKEIVLLGDTIRDYIAIDDVSNAFYMSINNPPIGFQVYNISTGIGTRLTVLTTLVFDLLEKKPCFKVSQKRSFDLRYNVLNNDKARKLLGFIPKVSLKAGLEQYIDGVRRAYK